jgi:cobalt-zinc-cadmium resistance protein CzcA
MDGGSLLPRLLPAPEKQGEASQTGCELRNKVMELEASLRRYNESLRYYTTSALKEAEELTKAANLQLQQSETGVAEYIQSVTTARDIRRGYIETVYQYNIAALEHELFE